ncbi:MAG: hypothetical protein MHMPM18_003423 [Marteilia pararefringens]
MALSDAEAEYMIENCQINFVEKNVLVIKQGDNGDHFYMLLDGHANVHKRDPEISVFDYNSDRNTGPEVGEEVEDSTKIGPVINRIQEKGSIFGELVIEASGLDVSGDKLTKKRRQASVVTSTRCCIAIFSRTAYNNAFKRAKQKDLNEILIKFLP